MLAYMADRDTDTDDWGDLQDRVELTSKNLRGLSHPLRVRLLGLLREDGPSTATKLAERVGQSSAATSYHLRQLETYGFIVEDPDRNGPGRERWWKSVHQGSRLGPGEIRRAPVEAEGFLRGLAIEHFQRLEAFLAEMPARPEEWDAASGLSDSIYRLTLDEAKALRADLIEVIERYRRDQPGIEAPPGAERVILQVHLLPQVTRPDPDTDPEEG